MEKEGSILRQAETKFESDLIISLNNEIKQIIKSNDSPEKRINELDKLIKGLSFAVVYTAIVKNEADLKKIDEDIIKTETFMTKSAWNSTPAIKKLFFTN